MAEQSLREAVSSASADLAAKPDGGKSSPDKSSVRETKSERVETPGRAEVADKSEGDEWQGPGWVNQWKKPSREKLRQLAKLQGANELLPDVLKEIEERYDYTGKQKAEFDQYRQKWSPYEQVLTPLEQRFALQGIHPQTGLQQMAAVNDLLQRDPDQALMMLAQNFKPRDAKALIQQLSQTLGVDLGPLVQSQGWVDPEVKKLIDPLQQQNRQLMELMQRNQQAQAQQYQQQMNYAAQTIASEIKAFKEATDDSGNPKYPHYDVLEPRMTAILQKEGVKPLEKLYEQALEELMPVISERAKRANAEALQEAERKTAETEKAMKASRNVNGSRTAGKDNKPADLRAAIKQQHKRLSG